jgi:hypothetical protein
MNNVNRVLWGEVYFGEHKRLLEFWKDCLDTRCKSQLSNIFISAKAVSIFGNGAFG